MIFESGDLKLGELVMFKDMHKWCLAMIETIYPLKEDDTEHDLALIQFTTGFHSASQPINRVSHGSEKGEWLRVKECKKLLKDEENAVRKAQGLPEIEESPAEAKGRKSKTAE